MKSDSPACIIARRVENSSMLFRMTVLIAGAPDGPGQITNVAIQDVCPTDLVQIGQGLKRFEKEDPARAARVQPIFISVDPERDTPDVMDAYVKALDARIIGMTGTPADDASASTSRARSSTCT